MVTELDEHEVNTAELSENGHEEESPEQLETALKNIQQLRRQPQVTFGKQELSLLQKILSTGTEAYRDQQFWRMCDFLDEDEARDHVAAYYEAKEIGLDTSFNVAFIFALCSANRKIPHTNLLAQLMDTLQHGKWATPQQTKGKGNNNGNYSRSPISS